MNFKNSIFKLGVPLLVGALCTGGVLRAEANETVNPGNPGNLGNRFP